MHKTFARLLPVILSVLIIFTLVQSTPVQAEVPVYENQVLIVPYSSQDEIAYLGKKYDVVEVDSGRQEAKIFSNQITRDAFRHNDRPVNRAGAEIRRCPRAG